jgi:hypothetical protein
MARLHLRLKMEVSSSSAYVSNLANGVHEVAAVNFQDSSKAVYTSTHLERYGLILIGY